MNLAYCLNQLSSNAAAIQRLLETVDTEQAGWKPSEADWSILEVLNHLVDEEKEDFRSRLQHLVSGSNESWPPTAPQQWVTDRGYNHRAFGESLANYVYEREYSLEWLRGLAGVEWQTRYQYPPLAGLSAGDLLASWVAHDLLHLRQLVELKCAHGQLQLAPYAMDYAEDWPATPEDPPPGRPQ
jgi:hypothetical protein